MFLLAIMVMEIFLSPSVIYLKKEVYTVLLEKMEVEKVL